jgi:hypothetical protein
MGTLLPDFSLLAPVVPVVAGDEEEFVCGSSRKSSEEDSIDPDLGEQLRPLPRRALSSPSSVEIW